MGCANAAKIVSCMVYLSWLGCAENMPRVKVFHTAKTMDEIIMLAPLLDYPTVFEISLHCTGKAPLSSCSLRTPRPVPHNPSTSPPPSTQSFLVPPATRQSGAEHTDDSTSVDIPYSIALSTGPSPSDAVATGARDDTARAGSCHGPGMGGLNKAKAALTRHLDPQPRLISVQGKWEGLVVWVGAWVAAFWALV